MLLACNNNITKRLIKFDFYDCFGQGIRTFLPEVEAIAYRNFPIDNGIEQRVVLIVDQSVVDFDDAAGKPVAVVPNDGASHAVEQRKRVCSFR